MQQEIAEYQALLSGKEEDNINDKIKRFNDVLFTKLSHLQYDMLTFNLPKDQIKVLVNKLCKSSQGFPEHYLTDLLVFSIIKPDIDQNRALHPRAEQRSNNP